MSKARIRSWVCDHDCLLWSGGRQQLAARRERRQQRHIRRTRAPFFTVLACVALVSLGVMSSSPASAGWIDPDSRPEDRLKSFKGEDFNLVFSDEFNREGRSFNDGADPRWTAVNKNDYTNYALQYYSQDYVHTRNGSMVINTNSTKIDFQYYDTPHKKFKKMSKTYVSAMVQGWNKFCFTGGIVEIRAKLPGTSDVGGLWPAMWLMGNLARATFTSSSDFQWPWSYNRCNRTTDEQADWQHQQEVSACDGAVHWGFHPHTGRGAPEIDILEAMAGTAPGSPYMSTSLQVSPGTAVEDRPELGEIPPPGTWYSKDIFYGNNSRLNNWFYGVHLKHKNPAKSYFCDAISGNHQLKSAHFETMHTYQLEWQPSSDEQQGYLNWYVDGERVYGITDGTLEKNGAQIPVEPMYMIFNTALSPTWGFPDCNHAECPCDCYDVNDPKCLCALDPGMYDLFPAEYELDWVRVYQRPNDSSHTVGCDPPKYPTKDFIKAHGDRYKDPDMNHVMLPVATGGGSCIDSLDCNGSECFKGKTCKCAQGWTGPNCLAAVAGDEKVPKPPAWPIKAPYVPSALSLSFGVLIGAFMVTLLVRYSHRRKRLLYATIDQSGFTVPNSCFT